MDARQQDAWDWDWEVLLPDHTSSSSVSHRGSKNNLDDQEEAEEHDLLPPPGGDDVVDAHDDECKDIGVVPDDEAKKSSSVAPSAAGGDPTIASSEGAEEAKEPFQSPADAKATADDGGKFAAQVEQEDEAEDVMKEKDDKAARAPQCVVFSVGKLKVNGIGALCSFGVAAATLCVFLVGGRQQQQHRRQEQREETIQLQFYGDDKRIHQVVQQTSRLNQAMSSVMGAGGGASARANISFGGFYDGF